MTDNSRIGSRHLVEQDLLDFIDKMTPITLSEELLPTLRAGFGARLELEEDPKAVEMVETLRRTVPGPGDDPDVGIALHLPREAGVTRGAILHIHGGGY